MNKTIYLNYRIDNVLVDPFSVTLGNTDDIYDPNAYGVKEIDGTVIVDAGTATTHISTGVYTYDIDNIEENKVYVVSWQIIATEGATPKYVSEEIGPFVNPETATIIDAVADFKGSFLQGAYSVIFLKITNFDGIPVNASTISTTILNSIGETVISGTPIRVSDGYYVYEWEIPADQEIGKYFVTWTYEVNNEIRTELQTIVVAKTVDGVGEYQDKLIVWRTALEKYITCAQSIPVYFEQSKKSRNKQDYEFSFKQWNQSAGVRIYRNGEIQNGGYSIDYFKGKVRFDQPLLEQDIVNADYNFRWFSDEELDRFLQSSVQILNNYPPATGFDLLTVFDRYVPVVLYGAAKDALRHLMMCLMFQEPQQVFGGGERAERVYQMIDTLKKNYEDDWREILNQKKFGPYPSIRLTVTPEFTLPGGRSRWFRSMFSGSGAAG